MDIDQGGKTMATHNGTHRENGFVTNIDVTDKIGFSNLPYREPLDLQFKDITYTVKMGWNKGNKTASNKEKSEMQRQLAH